VGDDDDHDHDDDDNDDDDAVMVMMMMMMMIMVMMMMIMERSPERPHHTDALAAAPPGKYDGVMRQFSATEPVPANATVVLIHKNTNKPVAVDKNFGERYATLLFFLGNTQ
jgi:hypothetical protein